MLSQPLTRHRDGKSFFSFVPAEGKWAKKAEAEVEAEGWEVKMVTTSGNSRDEACAKAAVVRQYVRDVDGTGIASVFAEVARGSSVRRLLLDSNLEVVSIRPTGAGGCEVLYKVDPGLFYCMPKVPGFEFVEWGGAVDAGRAGWMFVSWRRWMRLFRLRRCKRYFGGWTRKRSALQNKVTSVLALGCPRGGDGIFCCPQSRSVIQESVDTIGFKT